MMGSDMFPKGPIREFHSLLKRMDRPPHGPPELMWMGVPVQKLPQDLWAYQEILWKRKPSVVIEGGTSRGGSALYLACILELIGEGIVITLDRDEDLYRPVHPRILHLVGDTLSGDLWKRVEENLPQPCIGKVLILDDGHSHEHVEKELDLSMGLLARGDYLVVEDTDLGGPYWGLRSWATRNPGRLVRDLEPERWLVTQNPMGYYEVIG